MDRVREITDFVNHCIEPECDGSMLLQQLIKIQHRFACIPAAAIDTLQQRLAISATNIRAVIAFYSFLSLEDLGAYHILFSDNITDRMANNQALHDRLQEALRGHSATIGFASCTGLCDQGPGMLVNGQAINRLDEQRVDEIGELVKNNRPLSTWPAELFAIDDNIRRRDAQFEVTAGEGDAIRKLLDDGVDRFLQQLDESGLRGRGGAGFNTAKKWQLCQSFDADEHFVVCNADEGEPGTFKDRVLLNSDANSVIEGMTLCARVINARHGFIYLRGEYRYLLPALEQVLQQRRDRALLGQNILGQPGFDFDIDIHLGAGAYICGEESALIESLEGRRGIPRIRPPFPVESGYKNQPTVVNNVETFWSVSRIGIKGSDWFSQAGTDLSHGTRLLSISGDCALPGVYEYPLGIAIKDILQDCQGQDAQAVQISGAAGSLVTSKDFDHCISFEDLPTGGSFMVIGPQRDIMDMMQNFAQFFQHESCGFCTPCRIGTSFVADTIQKFRSGHANRSDLAKLEHMLQLMKISSFCGLGCSAPTAFLNLMQDSPHVLEALISTQDDNPVFDLDNALSDSRHLIQQQLKGP